MTHRRKISALTYCRGYLRKYFKIDGASDVTIRLFTGVYWTAIGSVFSKGLIFAATILIARILGVSAYGEYGLVQSTVGLFGVLSGFGLGITANKYVAELRKTDLERVGRILAISEAFAVVTGVILGAALFALAPWLSSVSLNAPHLYSAIQISALAIFLSAIVGAQTGALAGFESFKAIAYVNFMVGVFAFPALLCGAYFGGVEGAVWALVANTFIHLIFNHRALRTEVRNHGISLGFKDSFSELSTIWSYALPATLSTAVVVPANWACRALLAHQPDGFKEIGMLTAAVVFQTMVLFVSSMLSAPLLSILSSMGAGISKRLATVNMLAAWIVGLVVAVPMLSFPEVATLLFGNEYSSQQFKITFLLVIFCTTIMAYKSGLARVLAVNNLLWWAFISNMLWASILLGLAYILVDWGAAGIAVSLCVAYVVNTLLLLPLYKSRNLIPMKTLFSSAAMTIWGMLIMLLLFGIYEVDLVFRFVAFICSIGVMILCFRNLILSAE